jgi:hypothetical protein
LIIGEGLFISEFEVEEKPIIVCDITKNALMAEKLEKNSSSDPVQSIKKQNKIHMQLKG